MSGYGSMGGEGQQGMEQAKSDVARKADDVMDQARQQTGQAMDQVRGNAFQMMDQQKSRAADSLGGVAHALRQTGDNLDGGDQGALGQYAHRAADTVDHLSEQLRNKSVDQLFSEAEDFARREPEVFLGGAVLLGLLAARFLKASGRRSQMGNQDYGDYRYRSEYGRNYGQRQFGDASYDRGSWGSEGIDYRSTGTGGYRSTASGDVYGASSGDMSLGRERTATGRQQRYTGEGESHLDDAAWQSDEDELTDRGAGSSQA